MRKINKLQEPHSLTSFKRKNPRARYQDLTHIERNDIRNHCLEEQFYLCAYCCQRIEQPNSINEHIIPQHTAPNKSLDFTNIVASCSTPKQCDAAHEAHALPLTPLMPECETELKFKLSGLVEGESLRAKKTIKALNLGDNIENNKNLIEKRKQLIDILIWNHYDCELSNLEIEEPAILKMLIEELQTPVDGKLESFAPVLVNILKRLV